MISGDCCHGGEVTAKTENKNSRKCSHGMAAAGSYATALLAVILFLEPCCHCLPINIPTERDQAATREKWWHMPCDPGLELSTKMEAAGAGGQLKSLNRTHTQLKITGIHYNTLPLKDIYSEVFAILEEANNFDWLPEKQLERFKREYGSFEDFQKKGPEVLFDMHLALQKFAVTLDKLYHHHHNNPVHQKFNGQRRQILDGLCKELKMLLCEVEQSLITVGRDPPSPPLKESDFIPPQKWDDRHDKTAILIQDWGILRSYKNLLDDWTSILAKLIKSGKRKKNLRKHQRKGKGNKKQRSGSKEAEKNGEERSEGKRTRVGRRSGSGSRKMTRGHEGEMREKGRKRVAKERRNPKE